MGAGATRSGTEIQFHGQEGALKVGKGRAHKFIHPAFRPFPALSHMDDVRQQS